jgi:hypothetical protein
MRILVIGECDSRDMAPVREALAAECRGADVLRVRAIDDLQRPAAEEGWHPDLAIICQHWTREYTPADVRRLLELAPLARVMCCYGAWCASDGRNGTAWPLAVRVPVAGIAARLRRELEVLGGRRASLPLTASRDEVWLFDHDLLAGNNRAVESVSED